MMGKSVFFSEGTAGQMKSAPSFAKDDDSTLPKNRMEARSGSDRSLSGECQIDRVIQSA
jgi:hypothetical protein